MAKESRNFRLRPETLESIQRLSELWGVSQARVLELLVREAVEERLELRIVKGEREKAAR